MSELRIEVRDGSHCIAVWRNLLLQVWTDDPSTERNRTMRDIGRRFLLTTKGPVGAVVVVGAHCPVPQPAAREHVVGFLSDIGERAKGLALVFEGEGFLAAASRLAMMGMMSAARFPFDYRVARQVS
ncbi:MAG: hypothetical protein H5U40_06670 [Polyangiaceae bacterium]|nr:hypothetical protein [Polyangiaceae bacterium]